MTGMLVGGPDQGWVSPLREIERAAQDRAKVADLDMSAPDAVERLRAMVVEEVAEWRSQFRRGQRLQDIADPDGAVERAMRNLAGYGPLQPLLDDPDVWEIMVNGPASIFTKRHSGKGGYHHEVFHDDEHVVRVLTKILEDASRSHRKLDPAEGLQDAQLDNGARLHIVHADIGRDGQPLQLDPISLGKRGQGAPSLHPGNAHSALLSRSATPRTKSRFNPRLSRPVRTRGPPGARHHKPVSGPPTHLSGLSPGRD